jgi:hypothetical protein
MGLSFAITSADIFQIMIKWLIGGLRPHFLSVCRPEFNRRGIGYRGIYHNHSVCHPISPRKLQWAMMSFPSGHSAAAFAGFFYLSIWVNAKLKVLADYKSRQWQQALFALPILIALLISLSKISDHYHHWYDIIAGSLIGIFFAITSWRMMYCSVWNWRNNHIYLPYIFETDVATRQVPLRRDLTCIDFAGWQNKWSARPALFTPSTSSPFPGGEKAARKEEAWNPFPKEDKPFAKDMSTRLAPIPSYDELQNRKPKFPAESKPSMLQTDGPGDEEHQEQHRIWVLPDGTAVPIGANRSRSMGYLRQAPRVKRLTRVTEESESGQSERRVDVTGLMIE